MYEDVELEIIDINSEGQGVAKLSGKVIFVPGAITGDKISARIVGEKKNFSTAKMTGIIKASPDRINPICSHFGKCGSCQLQHLKYEAQLKYKQQLVTKNLQRVGKFDITALPLNPIEASDKQFGYRNKAQLPFGHQHKVPVLGYFHARSHEIVNVHQCHLHHPDFTEIVLSVRQAVIDNKIPIYLPEKHVGLLRHLIIRESSFTKELQICLVINSYTFPYSQLFSKNFEALNSRLSEYQITSALTNTNMAKTPHIFGDKNKKFWGNEFISEKIGDHFFRVAPNTFMQVNLSPAIKLYNHLKEKIPDNCQTILDLYCGIGTISLFIADKAQQVIGVEANKQAVKDAKNNALNNVQTNCKFIHGKAEDIHNQYSPEVIIVDPPRKGLETKVLRSIKIFSPKLLFYISCNPATLARDLRDLTANCGYKITEITPFDLFPQTTHVECFVALSKQ